MFCSHCGKQLPNDAKFCPGCGSSITAPVNPPAPKAPPAPIYAPPAPKPAQPAPVKRPVSAPKAKKSPLVPILIVIICVLVIALAIILGTKLFSTEDAPATTPVQNVVEQLPTAPTDLPEVPADEPEMPTEDPNPLSQSNPYRQYYNPDVFYILPESSQRYISQAELRALTDLQLELAAYEIDARHGIVFNDTYVQEYFDQQSWYNTAGDRTLTDMEAVNKELIQVCLAMRSGAIYQSGNPYISYLGNPAGYWVNDSADRYLNSKDLMGLSKYELAVIRTEIFARHGYIFSGDDLRQFYFCKEWYVPAIPGTDFKNSTLNKKEAANVALIKVYEQLAEGVTWSSKNPYEPYYDPYTEYIIPDSSVRELTDYDVMYMNKQELILARNEIFARHGYAFSSDNLLEYFAHCSWYVPDVAPGREDLIKFNKVEKANINLLKEYQSYWD